MKKITTLLIVSVLLASCTLPTMPWQKKPNPQEEIVPAENMNISSEVPVKSTDSTTTATNTPITDDGHSQKDITPSDTPKGIAQGGVYLPYTSTAVAQAKGNVVLFFHASWCPTCIAANNDIEAHLKDIPKSLTILKVNYDEATDLRELYEVTTQHTFVQVDNNGKLIKKWRGSSKLNEIIGQVQPGTDVNTNLEEGNIDTDKGGTLAPPPPPTKK